MTVIKDDTVDDNDIPIVALQPKDGILSHEQIWVRSMICNNGYFTLENPSSGAVFTACDGPWAKIKEYRACEVEGLHWVSMLDYFGTIPVHIMLALLRQHSLLTTPN